MLKSSILAKKACDVLREETFYLRKNQTVFSAIKRLVESHKPITGETLLETLGQDMDRREIKSYISYLMDEEWLGMGELQVSCHILIKKRIQRILLELGESCLEDLHE